MATKQTVKRKVKDSETVHFRPGDELGRSIGELADAWDVSRGEVAKRLVCLGIHHLDIEFHDVVVELADYMYGNTFFDFACHQIHIAILQHDSMKTEGKQTLEERLKIAKDHVADYRKLRGLEEVAKSRVVTVSVRRKM